MNESDANIPQDENNGNWVKEHRQIKHHKIWKCAQLYQLWRFLIMEAKWDNDVYSDGKIKIPLKRGQLVCSLSYLEYWLGMTRSKTHSKLKSLRTLNAIETEVKQGITVITICNYDKYQCAKNILETEVKQNRNTNQNAFETEIDPSKELKTKRIKELKKKEEENSILPVGTTPGTKIWSSYSISYTQRYGTEPTRNAKSNALCSQFAKRVPSEDAPMVMAFYLTHNDRWYVQKCHALEYAIKDAEKLHMEWKKGLQMTGTVARSVEQMSESQTAVQEHLRRKYGQS